MPDFGALLFLFSAQAGPQASNAGDDADPSGAEAVPTEDDSKPEKLSLQLVLTPALISLYGQPKQVVASQSGASGEFSEALDLSPIYSPGPALAQALPFEGRLPEEPQEAFSKLDAKQTDGGALSFPALFSYSSTPEQPAKSGTVLPGIALVAEAVEEILPLPAAIPQSATADNAQVGKERSENLRSVPEQAEAQKSARIASQANSMVAANPVLFQDDNAAEKNQRPEKKSESGGQTWAPASSRAESDSPREAANFAPPGLAVADARVAARVEGASSLPSERSGFFAAKNDVPARPSDKIEPNPQPMVIGREILSHGVEREKPTQPPPANAFSSVIERVAAEISTHTRQGQHEVTMRLEPPELGNLKIELVLDGDRLQARVTAEVADARNLIQTHLPELREALQAHKLDLVNVQVDLGGWNGLGGGLAQDAQRDSGNRWDLAPVPPLLQATESETKEPAGITASLSGAVSVWA